MKRRTHNNLQLVHPLAGELTIRYESLTLPGDADLALETYHAEPGSKSQEALSLLLSWGTDWDQLSGPQTSTTRASRARVRP